MRNPRLANIIITIFKLYHHSVRPISKPPLGSGTKVCLQPVPSGSVRVSVSVRWGREGGGPKQMQETPLRKVTNAFCLKRQRPSLPKECAGHLFSRDKVISMA